MAFQVVKTFNVKASPDTVWRFLIDVHRVARCLPGAAITDQIDEKTYTGTMTVKVGPVTTSYKGKVVFQKLDPEAHVAEISASGQDVKGKGGANMKLLSSLKEVSPGETEITAVSDLTITGLLAQMGRGMIQDVSDELFQLFSQRVRSELESAPAPAASSSASSSVSAPEVSGAAARGGSNGASDDSAPDDPASTAETRRAEALDLGSIGARAAGRAALRVMSGATFWIIVLAIAALVYWLFIR
jgi:uncharacterized protein